jgi:Protein of unknown function (DUF1501)
MGHHAPRLEDAFQTRRDFLCKCGVGLGALSLSSLMQDAYAGEAHSAVDLGTPLAPRVAHFAPKAKRIIHIFAQGGPSHVDTFDPKPNLTKYDGKIIKDVWKEAPFSGTVFGSPFKFQKHGQSGIEVSDIFPNVAKHVDEMTVIRSAYTTTPSHEHSMMLINTGSDRLIRPSLGAWATYGLGTENQNLPAFVCMSPGRPLQGEQNWQSAFLPGVFQGTYVDSNKKQVDQLIQYIKSTNTSLAEQRRQLNLLAQMNAEHAAKREKEAQLEARIQSFEIAYRMQMEATDAFDISREPANVRAMYGEGTQARQILIARRLVERGVRFVQVWQNSWDHHSQIESGMKSSAKEVDQAIGFERARHVGRHAGHLGRRVRPHAHSGREPERGSIEGQGSRPSQQGVFNLDGGRRREERLRVWRVGRVGLRRDPRQDGCAGLPRHGAAPARLQSREADLPLRGP